jgi:hypothetical protein
MAIPTSTSVQESVVIEAHISDVWHLIKLPNFSQWWSSLSKSEWVKGTAEETDIVKWTFADGTELQIKQEEHSVSFPDHEADPDPDPEPQPHLAVPVPVPVLELEPRARAGLANFRDPLGGPSRSRTQTLS